jgi:hypothetical protein
MDSAARITFTYLVSQTGAKAVHDSAGCQILRGNQLKAAPLAPFLFLNDVKKLRVMLLNKKGK